MFCLFYKHQWNTKSLQRRDLSCNHSSGDLFMCEDNMLFSHVKISRFRAKAHLVFHWCLYNNLCNVWIFICMVIFSGCLCHKLRWQKHSSVNLIYHRVYISAYILSTTLYRREKVGLLATQRWGDSLPKFNSPDTKQQLTEFATRITPECGIPELNFSADGIARHILQWTATIPKD